jgi:aminoglycoside phosphotransferase (APT) family kinase protein
VSTDTTPTRDGLAAALSRALSSATGEEFAVLDLERLSGGSSREIWLFTVRGLAGENRELILRRDPPGEARADGASVEFAAMSVARKAGVTVPEVLAMISADDPALPGGGMIMERVYGETLPRRILRSPELAHARSTLAVRCGTELGRLHAIDPSAVVHAPVEDRLMTYGAELDRLDPTRPVLELARRWLHDFRPNPRDPVLVHGDFRLGNFVISEAGLAAVLDWESVHVGDRLEDIGWIAVKAWRFRGPGVIGGFGDSEPFLAAYAEETGIQIGVEEFDWAVVLGTWIWAVGCLAQADRHLSGATRSVDLAVVGRRVVEIEYDLLELLG